jgi:hypothetical protein
MSYTTAFDVTQSGFRHWWFPAAGLIVIVLGAGMFAFGHRRVFDIFFLSFGCLWTFLSLSLTASDYFGLAADLRAGRCEVIEGVVEQFDPMPYTGHKDESFVVAGRRFHYSDYTITAGFNQSQSHGGPIHDGLSVRIHCKGNEIAKLEVAKPLQ